MGFESKFAERERNLKKYRKELLERAVANMKENSNVLAIYLAGSLAKGNHDDYSDIDLHIIVKPEAKSDFISKKKEIASKWGEVLYFEGPDQAPYIVTHYSCFIKVDSWFQEPNDLQPSVWLHGIKPLYDPNGLIKRVLEDSSPCWSVSIKPVLHCRISIFFL